MPNGYLLHEVVGFDYAQAALELTHQMSYDKLIEALGYESKSSIYHLTRGGVPDHVHGEALWALYVSTFGRKPPLKVHQKVQLA